MTWGQLLRTLHLCVVVLNGECSLSTVEREAGRVDVGGIEK